MYDDPRFYPSPPAIPKEPRNHGITVLMVCFMDFLVAGVLIVVLLCPSYHFTTLMFLSGASISFEVGLFNVRVTGNPTGFIGRIQPRAFTKFISNLIKTLDNNNLNQFLTNACYFDSLFMQLVPSGCNNFNTLRIVSYILASCIVVAAVLMILGAATLLVFWYYRRTILSFRLAFFFHIIPGLIVIMGLAIYLLLGGTDLEFGANIPLLTGDVNPIDLGLGFFGASGAAVLCLLVPGFMYFVFPKGICLDSQKRFEAEEAHEEDALLHALDLERQRLQASYNSPYSAQFPPILYPYHQTIH